MDGNVSRRTADSGERRAVLTFARPMAGGGNLNDVATARIGARIRGKWHVDKLLGIGGMGAVYAATHRNGSRVALKILHPMLSGDPSIRARFAREGYAANAVNHPGGVRVIDDDETDDGAAFLVMELLEGEACDARAKRLGGRLPVEEVVRIGVALLDVLAAAHAAGIVHRDIKPDNLFVEGTGALKVLDFGIARLREAAHVAPDATLGGPLSQDPSLKTRTGVTIGTPAFMPPEQALGRVQEVDALSDIWAAGATMFTLLTGKIVHDADTHMGVVIAAATATARKLQSVAKEIPSALATVVDKALAFDKKDRWQSATQMRRALLEAMPQTTPGGDHPSVAPERSQSSPPVPGISGFKTPSHPPPHATGWLEERRLATVVFAEIVGLSALSSDLEPDAGRELANVYLGPVSLDVERAGGTVVKYLGDTVMAVFGVPLSHEDDATRAVSLALALVERVAALAGPRGEDVRLRAGVHTGTVMVGTIGAGSHRAADVTGGAVHVASKIVLAAQPGQVLIGPATEQLTKDTLRTEPAEPLVIPGVQEPVRTFRALEEREGPVSSMRLQTASGAAFFARQAELDLVLGLFDTALRERALRIVEITGELGLGKSHLVRRARAALEARAPQPCILHLLRPAQAIALGVASRLLRAFFAVRSDEPAEALRARIELGVAEAWKGDPEGLEAGRLLADVLVAEPAPMVFGTELASGDATRVSGTLGAWLRKLAEDRPLCLVLEHVQWSDHAALEQLAVLVRALRKTPSLLVITSRAEATEQLPPWLTGSDARTRIELLPFAPEVMQRFLDDLFRNVPDFPRDLKREIVVRAEGNPELCKELVRLLVDRGAISVDANHVPVGYNNLRVTKLALPDTVRGVLQARLDGLPPQHKELLKLASVVGRTFWLGALGALSDAEPDDIAVMTDALRAREIVKIQATSSLAGEREFVFSTQALRDATYELVPRASAVLAHRKVAEWLGARGDLWEGAQAGLAMHLEAAGEHARARRLYLSAARRALGLFGFAEALESFGRALASWPDDTASDDRIHRAGVLRELALAEARVGRFDDALRSLARAARDLDLAGVPASDPAHGWIALEGGLVLKEYGRLDESIQALDRGLAIVKDAAPQILQMRLYSARSFQRAAKADAVGARADYEAGLAIGTALHVRDGAWYAAMARLKDAEGLTFIHAGKLELAEAAYKGALELREQAGESAGMQDAFVNLGGIAFTRGDLPLATSYYEKALAAAKKIRWPSREALGHSNLGQARLASGDAEGAVTDLERACALAEEGGFLDILADSARALAEAELALGATDTAVRLATEAIAHAERARSPFFEGMAHGALMDALLGQLKINRQRGAYEAAILHKNEAIRILAGCGQAHLAEAIENRFQQGSGATVNT